MLLLLLTVFICSGGKETFYSDQRGDIRIMFYNVENLFDTINDPDKEDDEFLPGTLKNWNSYRYYSKLKKIYQVTVAAGGWEPPEIIGLCEVENKKVLYDLIHTTPLVKYDYKVVHYESPDTRGIDVAFMYRQDIIHIINSGPININSIHKWFYTRDILYVKAKTTGNDTVHFMINHWPSRWGGQEKSAYKREIVASVLKQKLDSLFDKEKDPNIILMGDFNDNPENNSLQGVLNALSPDGDIESEQLYNMSYLKGHTSTKGTIKYKNQWNLFDQILISGTLLDKDNELSAQLTGYRIFSPGFLLEKDDKYLGTKPFRTYYGMRYNDGFSDHLPVYIDLWKKRP